MVPQEEKKYVLSHILPISINDTKVELGLEEKNSPVVTRAHQQRVRRFCDICATSTFYFFRVCLQCGFELCESCYLEMEEEEGRCYGLTTMHDFKPALHCFQENFQLVVQSMLDAIESYPLTPLPTLNLPQVQGGLVPRIHYKRLETELDTFRYYWCQGIPVVICG